MFRRTLPIAALTAGALAVGGLLVGAPVAAADGAPVLPMRTYALSADMNGDGRGEVLAIDGAGVLWEYPGQADASLGTPYQIGTGFGDYQVAGPGDLDGDGKADVLGISPDGRLWLFAGHGTQRLSPRRQVGYGWTGWRLVPVGDLNGDGRSDLLGINATGGLFAYPGRGDGTFGARQQVGSGWIGWRLYPAGDLNGDGLADILGINSKGTLYSYLGRGDGSFQPRTAVGSGWTQFLLASGADLNGDGRPDLLGCSEVTGTLYAYRGLAGLRYAEPAPIQTNWCRATPPDPFAGFDQELAKRFGSRPYAVSVLDLSGAGRDFAVNDSRVFTAASTYKVYVAYAMIHAVETGQATWNSPLNGTTLLTCFKRMIINSDNACPIAWNRAHGYNTLTAQAHALGAVNTNFANGKMRTTAGDLALVLGKLYRGELVGPAGTQLMIDTMKVQVYRSGIPTGIGTHGVVADKVGFLYALLHDAAIVYSDKGNFVLVVMTDQSSWADIAAVARSVYSRM